MSSWDKTRSFALSDIKMNWKIENIDEKENNSRLYKICAKQKIIWEKKGNTD